MNQKLAKIIEGYEEVIINELSERCKDVVYKKSLSIARQTINILKNVRMEGGDSIDLDYTITFIVNDILQIIGRIERKGEKNGKR